MTDKQVLSGSHAVPNSAVESPPPQLNSALSHPRRSLKTWLLRTASLQPRTESGATASSTPAGEPLEVSWGIHWYTPVNIVGLFLCGSGTAIAHHMYYSTLDKSPAGNAERQQWVSRIGTGLAFLFKSTLVAMVGIARKQCLWTTLRTRFLTLQGIDAVFGVTSDPRHFANPDMLLKASLATFMALVMWTIPLSTLISPGTISVQPGGRLEYNTTWEAFTVKYEFDEQSSSVLFEPQNAYSLARRYRNQYKGPSDFARGGLVTAAYAWGTMNNNVAIWGCPTDSQCSYNFTAILPSIHCSQKGYYDMHKLAWEAPIPWASLFVDIPEEKYPIFLAKRDESNNTIWIGHTDSVNKTDILRHSIFQCRNSLSQYHLRNLYENGSLFHTGYTLESKTFLDDALALEPPESHKYDASSVVFDTLVEFLEGSILADTVGDESCSSGSCLQEFIEINRTQVGAILLLDTLFSSGSQRIIDALVDVTFNMSILPIFIGNIEGSALLSTTCLVEQPVNIYVYDQQKLLFTYASAVAISIVMAVLGFYALGTNGVATDANFSTILLTTRNPSLDQLAEGCCIGGSPLPDHLKHCKLRFGEVPIPVIRNGIQHTAMGLEGEVSMIRRGGRYS